MKKILYSLLALMLLVILAAIILPYIYKDKIFNLVKEEANKNVSAKINFSNDIGLSLFTNFPDLSLSLKEICVEGIDDFAGDTLFYTHEFTASLDIMSVIKGDLIKLKTIRLIEPKIHAIVLKDGKANWNITKSTSDSSASKPDTSSAKFNISLKLFEIKNATIIYDDKKGGTYAQLVGLNHTLEGDFSQDNCLITTATNVSELLLKMNGINYLNNVSASIKANIDANLKDKIYTIKENEIALNELTLTSKGMVAMMADDINIDMNFGLVKSEFKNFLSLVPGIYSKDFKDLTCSGKLGFDAQVKGIYNANKLPSFVFNLAVENGMFQYPTLPTPVKNVQIAFKASNPDGVTDHTLIDLSKFHFEVASDEFDAKLLAKTPVSDPDIDASFKGRLNLDNITKIVPLQKGVELHGNIASDIEAKGKLSAIEQKQFDRFYAKGSFEANNIAYKTSDEKQNVNISKTTLLFNPSTVTLKDFDGKVGSTHLSMSGELSNFFGYFFSKGTLSGKLRLESELIDLNTFMASDKKAETTAASPDTASMKVVEVPGNIKFDLTSNIAKLIYTNVEITNFKGNLKIADQKVSFDNISFNTLGSAIKINGFYETTNSKSPSVAMDFDIKDLDIQKSFVTFNTIKRIAPIAEKTKGTFSANFKMISKLDTKMNPVYETMFAEGVLTVPHAEVNSVGVMVKLADALKQPSYKQMAINNVRIQFKVEKGRIYTKPFDLNAAGQKLTLSGSTGLDQTIDYKGTALIPRKELGAINNQLNALMSSLNQKAGSSIKLSENIPLGIIMGGTFSNPTVSTNLEDLAKSEARSLQDQAAAELERQKRELEAKARAEADRIKKEVEDKARAEANRIKAEAEARAKAEQDKLKKQAEEEAKKKLKGLFGK